MPQRPDIELLERVRAAVHELVTSYPAGKAHCRYADVRIEVSEGKVALAENGMDKFSAEDYGLSFGVRAIAGEKVAAAGYFGQQLGARDVPQLLERLREGLDHAYERAL